MNCLTHSARNKGYGRRAKQGWAGHIHRPRRPGTIIRFKEALYDLVDMTARERFEGRKPRF